MKRTIGFGVATAIALAGATAGWLWLARGEDGRRPPAARRPAGSAPARLGDVDRARASPPQPMTSRVDEDIEAFASRQGRLRGRLIGFDPALAKEMVVHVASIFRSAESPRPTVVTEVATDGTFAADVSRLFTTGEFLDLLEVTVRIGDEVKGNAVTHVPDSFLSGLDEWWVDVRLKCTASVSGRIVDEARKPLAGAMVSFQDVDGVNQMRCDFTSPIASDSDGRFSWVVRESGEFVVSARRNGHRSADARIVVRNGDHVEIPDLVLERGCEIRGRVRLADGTPVPGAAVVARGERRPGRSEFELTRIYSSSPPTSDVSETTADADGRFQLTGLEATTYRVFIDGIPIDAGRDLGDVEQWIDAPASGVELILPIHGRLVIEVRSVEQPLAGAFVRIAGKGTRTGVSDAEGRVAFDAVPTATYKLRVSHDGFDDAIVDFEAPLAGVECWKTVTLEPSGPRPSLVVTIDGPDDEAPSEAQFQLMDVKSNSMVWQRAIAAEDGRFSLDELPPGRYALVVALTDEGDARRGWFVRGVNDLELLAGSGTRELTLTANVAGRLSVSARVNGPTSVHDFNSRVRQNLVDAHGDEVFDKWDALQPGEYTLHCSASGYASRSIPVHIVAGETTAVDVVLEGE